MVVLKTAPIWELGNWVPSWQYHCIIDYPPNGCWAASGFSWFDWQPLGHWTPVSGYSYTVDFLHVNTLRLRQHGHHFPDDIFKCFFVNENVWIFSLNIVPDGPIKNIPALVQIMAWHRLGDKPLSEPIMVLLLRHIPITRPQWVKPWIPGAGNRYSRLLFTSKD